MDVVCEVCGAVGYKHLLVQCNSCRNATRHSGIMKIGQEYISLAAHLSNQACKKVQELSRSLPPVMKVTKHSKLKAWPKRWEASSEPTAESIGLYFFSDNMRPNKDLDRLVQYVTDHSIILKYVFGVDKLLIFPSVLLPEQCQSKYHIVDFTM